MNVNTANTIYSLLVNEGGAPDGVEREAFIIHFTGDDPPREWRFRGHLGFGGKFCIGTTRTGAERWYVDCYPEDLTTERQKIMDGINSRLACYQ